MRWYWGGRQGTSPLKGGVAVGEGEVSVTAHTLVLCDAS